MGHSDTAAPFVQSQIIALPPLSCHMVQGRPKYKDRQGEHKAERVREERKSRAAYEANLRPVWKGRRQGGAENGEERGSTWRERVERMFLEYETAHR